MLNFISERITDQVIRITDPLGVFTYLVIGDEKAALIDTGYGFGDLKGYVESLTDKPLVVILTHGHVDHANGCAPFSEVYMSYKDLPVYAKHSSQEFLRPFKENSELKDLPYPEVRKEFKELKDKQIFDLGNYQLEAVSVPGHTPGMTMILFKKDRMMLFGDGCGPGTILLEDWSSKVKDYKQSLLNLKQYDGKYDRIIRNHGTGESKLELLPNVTELCDLILEGKDDHELVKDSHMIETEEYRSYNAKKKDKNGNRADGKEGNITYREDKA